MSDSVASENNRYLQGKHNELTIFVVRHYSGVVAVPPSAPVSSSAQQTTQTNVAAAHDCFTTYTIIHFSIHHKTLHHPSKQITKNYYYVFFIYTRV